MYISIVHAYKCFAVWCLTEKINITTARTDFKDKLLQLNVFFCPFFLQKRSLPAKKKFSQATLWVSYFPNKVMQ